MTSTDFIKALDTEKDRGLEIISILETMEPIHTANVLASMAGVLEYNQILVDELTTQIYVWEMRVREIIKLRLGSRPDIVNEIVLSTPEKWVDFKQNGIKSMKHNINVIRSILDRLDYIEMNKL